MKSAKVIFILLGLQSILLMQSCCSPCDGFPDAVWLEFSGDVSNNGFSKAEIDTLLMIRLDKKTNFPIDTAQLLLDSYFSFNYLTLRDTIHPKFSVYFDDGFPFPKNKDRFFNYHYLIKPQTNIEYLITDIRIVGNDKFLAICSCYANTQKIFKLNGVEYDESGDLYGFKAPKLTK